MTSKLTSTWRGALLGIAAAAAMHPTTAAPLVFESIGKSGLAAPSRDDPYAGAGRNRVGSNGIYHAAGVHVRTDESLRERYFVVDSGNNRILHFQPTSIVPEWASVIGQPSLSDMSSCNRDSNRGFEARPTASTLCLDGKPWANNAAETWTRINVDTDRNGNLYVPDRFNNRILVFKRESLTDSTYAPAAALVFGQPDMTSNGANQVAGQASSHYGEPPKPTARSLWLDYSRRMADHVSSRGVSVDAADNIWVADTYNGRVMRFSQGLPGKPDANLVLGKPSFTENGFTAGCMDNAPLNAMCTPTLAKVNPVSGYLYVIDERPLGFKARILEFRPPFSNGMSAARAITVRQPGRFVNWDGGFLPDGTYRFQATGMAFERTDGHLMWVTEHDTRRAVLIDMDGNIRRVMGAIDALHRGFPEPNDPLSSSCGYAPHHEGRRLLWPGGNLAFARKGTQVVFADEGVHAVHTYAYPYVVTSKPNGDQCLPLPLFTLFTKDPTQWAKQPNMHGPGGEHLGEAVGMHYANGQLIVADELSYLKVYQKTNPDPRNPQFRFLFRLNVPGPGVVASQYIGEARDEQNQLWMVNGDGGVDIWRLPLTPTSTRVATSVRLLWADGSDVNARIGHAAFDPITQRMYLLDRSGARILRLARGAGDGGSAVVDMVIGQTDRTGNQCNQGIGSTGSGGSPQGLLCKVGHIKFDRRGNLFAVDNRYECQGNRRMVAYTLAQLATTSTFPNLRPAKIFNAPGICAYDTIGRPGTPVSLAFDNRNRMVVGNDGYYGDDARRVTSQLWLYNDPLAASDAPDAVIRLPMGTPGDLQFDEQNNLLVRDVTWSRIFKINIDIDASTWLARP